MTFDPRSAELHLGILYKRIQKVKGEMAVCDAKINMENPEKHDIDTETEQLNLEKLKQDYEALQGDLVAYEDQVLSLTQLTNE